ncbi:RNA polymerase sigma factor, partial [SCandidatus Aminicenantes bacterium Aminicenantia_JdfR_composite]|nr:RNA polymerase sigma factor [SCandidatus Aminicenantes bacterium Aminicenantia_JdfR_composite]
MDLKKFIKTKQFVEEISNSIKVILLKTFPEITREEKEDIAQEVKLKIWKMISSGKKIKNLKSYLWKVVYTTALDIIKERENKVSLEKLIVNNKSNPLSQFEIITSKSTLNKKELKLIMQKAINSLPQNRRVVIKLHLAGMSFEEMAEFLKWSENKVRHLYYRGLKDLKEKLKEYGIT